MGQCTQILVVAQLLLIKTLEIALIQLITYEANVGQHPHVPVVGMDWEW